MAKDFVVIRGDVVDSTLIDKKENFWKHFDKVLEELNREYKDNLRYPFEIVKGDEFTGVSSSTTSAYDIAKELIEKMFPYHVRVVVSAGELDQSRISKNINELDGKVFWKASKAIDELKKSKRYFRFEIDDKSNDVISSLADMIVEIKVNWTKRELEIIKHYDRYGNQKQTAKELKISQQSVSDGLRRAKHKLIREAEKSLLGFI
ncbi:MAG: SatD family protein [Candidatus Heimdallarchaeaceae archaeon]|jgi:predicted DNA-binding protein (UPF0251 family)